MFGKLIILELKVIFLGDFSIIKIFLIKLYRVNMTTTLNTSCSENIFFHQGGGFCMHVNLNIISKNVNS
jgi:hypothetical protein